MPDVAPMPKAQADQFVMPSVDPGDTVIWLSHPDDTRGHLLTVTDVHTRSIDGVRPGVSSQSREALRHRNDPELLTMPALLEETGGCWVESAHMLRMREIETAIASMAEELGTLRAMVAKKREG